VNYRTAAHEAIGKSFSGKFFGYIPDSDVKRRQKDASLFLKAPPLSQSSLVQYEASVLNQGDTGSCTGHGTSQGVYTSLIASGVSPAVQWVPSPRMIYALARTLERSNASQPLTDSGAMPSDLLTVLRQYGIQPIAAPTPDGRYSDVWGPLDAPNPNVNNEVSLLDLETSGLKLLTGEYRIDEINPQAPAQIQAALAQKTPAGIGIFVDSGFQGWNPASGPISSINLNDPQGGGHWLALTYCYTTPAGVLVLGGPNSWGSGWPGGTGVPGSPFWLPGHYEITASALLPALSDCILFPVQVLS
jgi:hypothetical protein